jgi:TPP-dependent pyruvate/acetoin dehydrogenase alpha subunit
MMISRELNPDDQFSLLSGMLLIRRLEETLIAEYPNQEMRCPVHFSIGQEAIAVGVSAFLGKNDWVVSNHRSHAHYIAKGGNLLAFVAEIYGKATGCCVGRGGSMHLTDLDAGFLAAIPIVGSSMSIAAGVAMSQQRRKSESFTVVYIGDATVETGSFHETLNYVSLHSLPLMTVCENNEFSVYSHLEVRQPKDRTITGLARGHGIKTFEGNGDDIVEVVAVMREARGYMVRYSKPVFIEFKTYRLLEHCGPNSDDDLNYRDIEQVKNFKNRDPIKILLEKLYSTNELKEGDFLNMDLLLRHDLNDLIDLARKQPDANYNLQNTVYWSGK